MKKTLLMIALGIFVSGQTLIAQDEKSESKEMTIEAFSVGGQDGGGAPMIIQTTEDNGNGVRSNMRIVAADGPMAMSFMGDDGHFMTMGGMGAGGDDFSMLQNPSVQKDLELVDQQTKQIRDIQKAFSAKIRDAIGDLSKNGFNPEKAKDLSTVIKGMKAEQKEQISKILLPHQQDRIKQIALQMQMKSRGTAGALSNDTIAKALNISTEQKERLKKRESELKKEMQEKIAQFKQDMKDALLKELNSDQRKQLKKMTGDSFKSESKDWQSTLPKSVRDRIKRRSSKKSSDK